MKEVIYKDGEEHLLTNKEFKEALVYWDERKNYWFDRGERMLTPFYISAGTPPDELGREIFVNINSKYKELLFKNKDKWFQLLGKGNGFFERDFHSEEFRKKFVDGLVPQDDFYNNKTKLLN